MTYLLVYSGFSFIGDVPNHWVRMKLRNILTRSSSKNHPNLQLLSVTRERGVIIRDTSYGDDNHNYIPEDLSNYKVVRAGQLAMNKMKAWQGSYGISKHDGIVSPAYFVFVVSNCDPDFLHIVLRSKIYVPLFGMASDGVRTDQWDLNINRMKEIPLYIPPVNEQARIVRYLDHKNRLINKYIHIKKKQIELLKELKQAIINDAVTGKIDVSTGKPYPKYKDSEVESLGMVPEEWKEIRLKQILSLKSGENITSQDIDKIGTYPVYGGNGLRGYTENYTHDGNHILIGRQGALCGNIHKTSGKIWASEHALVADVNSSVSLDWLAHLLDTMNLGQYSETAAQPGISISKIVKLPIPYPSIHKQKEIQSFLVAKVGIVNTIIQITMQEVSLIIDLQTRLISDVVTGKLDVRNVEIPKYEEDPDLIEEDSFDESIEEAVDANRYQ